MDVASTIPFNVIYQLVSGRSTGWFRYLNLLRLWRLQRVSKLFARYVRAPRHACLARSPCICVQLYSFMFLQVGEVLGSCFGAPKVSHEEAASAEVVSKRWPKVPFHGASAF
jgi:hypothetical protein